MSNLNEDMENAVIADLERQIETLEYERSKSDIQSYLSVTQSLEGLLGNEKTVKHIKDFVIDERCEENVFFLMDVSEYKKMYNDENYNVYQKILKVNKIVKQYLVPVGSHCSCNR